MSDYQPIAKYLKILQLLPRYPQSITVTELIDKLKEDNFDPGTRRTIERNLYYLSRHFPIVADTSSKPFKWSWAKGAESYQIPGLTPTAALITLMAWEHLRIMMPDIQLAEIRAFQDQARAVLSPGKRLGQYQAQALDRWLTEKTAIVNTQPIKPARPVASQIIDAVHDALYRDCWLKIGYRNVMATQTKAREVAPLALVIRDQIAYLVVRFRGYEDLRIIHMQRIEQAEILDEPVDRAGFKLEDYLAEQPFEFGDWGVVKLKLLLSEFMTQILTETPLSEDQRIETDPDDPESHLLTATVGDTRILRQWLLAQGSDIVVLEPQQTRNAIAEEVMILSEQYAD